MAYWSKFNTSDDGIIPIGSNLFGTCSTSASTTTKTVSLSDFDVLVDGVTVHVYFEHKNEASNPTLKVGSTSASPIYCEGVQGGVWDDASVASFTYHNGRWYQNDYQQGGGGEVYSLSISGDTLTLTGDGGTTSSVNIPDDDTKYGISISGHTISLVEGGSGTSVTVPDNNTTYTMSISGHTITLTPSSGSPQTITVPDNNTTYTISISGNTITLTPSSGTAQTITVPNDNTTYSISGSGDTVTLTGSDGSTSTATIADDNTTYTLTKSGSTITLTGSDGTTNTVSDADTTYGLSFSNGILSLVPNGNTSFVSIPDENTTYTISISGNDITLTGSDGSTNTITVPDADTTYTLSGSGNTVTLTGSDGSTSSATVSGGGATYPSATSAEIVAGTDTTDKVSSPAVLNEGIVDLIYPIGSIYMSVNAVDPATLFPGTTWSQIQDKFLLAAGSTYSNGSSGGEATHTLTPSETALKTHTHNVTLGSHRHYPYGGSSYKFVQSNGGTVTNAGGISGSGTRYYITAGISKTTNWQAQTGATDLGSKTTDGLTEANGSAHNNMPPYLTVNIWQRVS